MGGVALHIPDWAETSSSDQSSKGEGRVSLVGLGKGTHCCAHSFLGPPCMGSGHWLRICIRSQGRRRRVPVEAERGGSFELRNDLFVLERYVLTNLPLTF